MDTELAIGIVAHVDRFDQASDLYSQVRGDFISYDSGQLGCHANHMRVWQRLTALDSGWTVVLEDDAQPVNDFRAQLTDALEAAPSPVAGLYLGTSNPIHWQPRIKQELARADNAGAHWLACKYLLHAVAVAIRTELVPDMLSHVRAHADSPIDESISKWAIRQGHSVSYTVPSLCDHADGETVIGRHPDKQHRSKPRKAWRIGQRSEWFGESVALSL